MTCLVIQRKDKYRDVRESRYGDKDCIFSIEFTPSKAAKPIFQKILIQPKDLNLNEVNKCFTNIAS